MTYTFVPAKWFSPNAIIEVRALVIHFAEGGNTVHYFQTVDKDVSSHFVLQYDGSIVQMVKDQDADHCQHVDTGTWSYAGNLTPANGRAVLGSEVMDNPDHTRVNRYVHAIEIEGFRDQGMNLAQETSLIAWVAERRTAFPTIRGLLGHGDVQNKACPGSLIPWAALGGHGLFTGGDDVARFVNSNGYGDYKLLNVAAGFKWLYLDGSAGGSFATAATVPVIGLLDSNPGDYVARITTGMPYTDGVARSTQVLIRAPGSSAYDPAPAPPPDCSAEVAAAEAAEHERTKAAAIAAVEGIS